LLLWKRAKKGGGVQADGGRPKCEHDAPFFTRGDWNSSPLAEPVHPLDGGYSALTGTELLRESTKN
jgi:hypothetical protein